MKTIVIDGREVIDVDAEPDTPSNVADAHALVKELAGGCKVKVVYGERSANTPNEDNGPLAASAQRVISLQVVLSDGRLLDIFFYDELAAMVNNVRPTGSLVGILLQVRVDPARVVPAEPHPRMVHDKLLHRRRAGRVALALPHVFEAAGEPDTPFSLAVKLERWKVLHATVGGPYPFDDDALRKLKRLRDDGMIGDDEFVQGKKKALGIRRDSREG